MANWGQWGLQDANSPLIEQLIFFYDHATVIIVLVLTLVGWASTALILNSYSSRTILEGQEIETIWTILPAVTLVFLALPSLRLLYLLDEVNNPVITIKTIGRQWYWRYEYSDFTNLEFDSYIIQTPDLNPGDYRLLEVDNRAVLPIQTEIRVLVTSSDVIHSWTIPSLGVKADAIPGRLNQLNFTANRPGVFYGQCSEICGANHSFIPIALEIVDTPTFIKWITATAEEWKTS